ncbi:MAG: dienelactone hydrolase family protein [Deltaproteobacteria bacterium]|nr:dienelactone hydrolase family protein [Deltaproteobacteria bacterium]
MPSQIQTETVKSTAGGASLESFRAVDERRTGKRPGVLVFHEWWGLDDHMKRRARMLAELGYTALAVDMYGDGQVAADAAEANRLMGGLLGDLPAAEARLKASLQKLAGDPTVDASRIGAIGYCLGGAMVLHAARLGLPLAGVVSFHGSLGSFHTPAPGSVRAKILVCHGGADVLVPDDQVAAFKREMDAAKADYRVIVYDGALHGFTNPAATESGKKNGLPLAYDAAVDERSWKDMKDFFAKAFARA